MIHDFLLPLLAERFRGRFIVGEPRTNPSFVESSCFLGISRKRRRMEGGRPRNVSHPSAAPNMFGLAHEKAKHGDR